MIKTEALAAFGQLVARDWEGRGVVSDMFGYFVSDDGERVWCVAGKLTFSDGSQIFVCVSEFGQMGYGASVERAASILRVGVMSGQKEADELNYWGAFERANA